MPPWLRLRSGSQPSLLAAKTPCWQQVINEWHDNNGRVSATYPLHCYREAIAHVPEDLRVYTGIVEEIIERPAAGEPPERRAASDGRKRRPDQSRRRQASKPPRTQRRDPSPAVFKQGLDKLGSRNADTVPLPLLIIAALSLLLIAAGGAGLVSRRLRARKVPG